MINEYKKMGMNNWIASIPPTDVVLQKILTFKEGDQTNRVCVYVNTPEDAHRYCRNTCSHYLKHWRKLVRVSFFLLRIIQILFNLMFNSLDIISLNFRSSLFDLVFV
jgi:hypothetical protein